MGEVREMTARLDRELGRLSADHGLELPGVALLLGVSRVSLWRWRKGEHPVPGWLGVWVRALEVDRAATLSVLHAAAAADGGEA